MVPIEAPLVVWPPVYELPAGRWYWCKLKEVCDIIPGVACTAGLDFSPTPADLVHRFAALVRFNKVPSHLSEERREEIKRKIFRYSQDGWDLTGKDVPFEGHEMPPYTRFDLGLYDAELEKIFVPLGWALDTLRAVRQGAVAAVEWEGGLRIGFPPNSSSVDLIHLEGGNGEPILARVPDCV